MDELKNFYKEGLVARIEALQVIRDVFEEDPEAALPSLNRIVHNLKGSGKTYGFDEISKAAAAFESANEEEIPGRLKALIALLRNIVSEGDPDTPGILIVDDDPAIGAILQRKLGCCQRRIFLAHTAARAEEILLSKPVSLVILDLILPDMDGRTFLARLRETARTAALPVFVLTALRGAQPKTECFALGADEYFEKPLDPETFSSAVAAKLHQAGRILSGLHQDPLTGLMNRVAFSGSFDRVRAYARRSREPLSLAMLDLDFFKSVNDRYGHAMGDEVLVKIAEIFTESLRKSDLVGRWGGEEFVVLFPGTRERNAVVKLKKMLDNLSGHYFRAPDGSMFNMTFSAGVAAVDPAASSTLEEEISRADQLLYKAKIAGRNRIFSRKDAETTVRMKVLLAEDDATIARVVRQHLEIEGFEVDHCKDGLLALASAQKRRYQLAILDVKMPMMDGFELLRRLRELSHCRNIPVVLLTAMGDKKDIINGMRLGANDYIVKPFSPPELVGRLRSLMRVHENPVHR
jgi:diguanylate cyclase (GGDEF)-like protein